MKLKCTIQFRRADEMKEMLYMHITPGGKGFCTVPQWTFP